MVAGAARRRRLSTRGAAQKARNSTLMSGLARAGLAARGVMYILIGVIAVQIAFGSITPETAQARWPARDPRRQLAWLTDDMLKPSTRAGGMATLVK